MIINFAFSISFKLLLSLLNLRRLEIFRLLLAMMLICLEIWCCRSILILVVVIVQLGFNLKFTYSNLNIILTVVIIIESIILRIQLNKIIVPRVGQVHFFLLFCFLYFFLNLLKIEKDLIIK